MTTSTTTFTPPAPSTPTTLCDSQNVACVNTDVADAEVLSAFAAYVCAALAVLTAFGIARKYVPIYTGREHLRSLKTSGCAPPRFDASANRGGAREACSTTYGWIAHVLTVADSDIVHTAGLDALVFLRIAQFGTQLFAPLALVGVLALAPTHLSRSYYETTTTSESSAARESHVLMRMTIANVEPTSSLMWMHVVMFWAFTAYALWLLTAHYRSYEFLRQVYGTTTGESNPWRAVHIPQTVLQKFLQQGINTNREFMTETIEEEEREGGQTPAARTMPTTMLLEALLGPKRSNGQMSTEQKLRRFPRASFIESTRGPSMATPSRGYHSHFGPLRVTETPREESSRSVSEISMASMSDFDEMSKEHHLDKLTSDSEDVAIRHNWWEGLDIAEEVWSDQLRSGSDGFGSTDALSAPRQIKVDIEGRFPCNDASTCDINPVPSIDDRRYVSAVADEVSEDGSEKEVVVSVLVQNYCVLMTDVGGNLPEGAADPWEGVRAVETFFGGLFPDDFLMVIPLQDYRPVDDLLIERDKLKNEIEKQSMLQSKRHGHRRMRRGSGFRDEITGLRDRVAILDHLVVQERTRILQTEPGSSCIVAFKSQYAAACAAQCRITSRQRDLFAIEPAPGPDNLNWQSILLRRRQREIRSMVIFPLILTIILIPTGMFTGVMSSLCVANQFGANHNDGLKWYCSSDSARYLRILVQGILPPILLTLWETFVVSFGMMYLVQAQSKYCSLSKTDESFAEYYFLWAFLNVFFGTVSGYAIQRYLNALNTKGPDAMLQLLGTSLPLTSNFFLLWIVFRGVYLPTQRLIFPHPGVLCMIVNRWLCCLGCNVTARDRTIKYSPRSVRLGREVGVFAMVMMIGLVFSTVAPLITLLCTVFFVFNFVIWRYHVLYVYERSYEAGGAMWTTFCNLTIYALMIAQSFLSFVLLSKQAYAGALILWITVLPVLSKASHRFRSIASELRWSVPLPQASIAPRAEFNAETYMHPALKRNSMGWHPEIGKVWRGYPNVTVKETRIFRRRQRHR